MRFSCVIGMLFVALLSLHAGAGACAAEPIWVYQNYPQPGEVDRRSEIERAFAPFGYMPAARTTQISVDQQALVNENDATQGTCVEYQFDFKRRDDWVGAYTLIGGVEWGTKPGFDVQTRWKVGPQTPIVLRFRAKGKGAVSFKMGGVREGKYPSSLPFAVETRGGPVKLTADFVDYTIGPVPARQLTNLIDPFCVVAAASDNVGLDSVSVFVDDIRLEVQPAPKPQLPANWRERLNQTLLLSYTPTGFNPVAKPVKSPTAAEIRADLAAIRVLADGAGIEGRSAGIVAYGCRDGLETIPALAREANLSVILGIFNPRDQVEVDHALAVLQDPALRETIIGCCIGNEAITFRRASLEDIQSVAARIRQSSNVPLTTTEIVQAYGDKRLFEFDFSFVNAHALFADVFEPEKGANWATRRIEDLLEAAPKDHLTIMKELGWPAAPKSQFDDAQQFRYWEKVFNSPAAKQVNICIFDCLNNVAWKEEQITLPGGATANIGPGWPALFQENRQPKEHAAAILKLWKKSRSLEK